MDKKKSFVLYADLIHTIKKLPPDKAGKLFIHILEYVNNLNPKTDDIIIDIAFEPIKQQLKRDLEKYNAIVERNKINGSKGGRPKPKKPSGLSGNPNKPKKPDNDNDNDSDNGNDIKNNQYKEFILLFNDITGKNFRGDDKSKRQFNARMNEGFSLDDFSKAINNCKNDKFHMQNPKYLSPEFITRSDKLNTYLNATPSSNKPIFVP